MTDRLSMLTLDLLADLCSALDAEITARIRAHEARHHGSDNLRAGRDRFPFARQHLPDAVVVAMIEALESDSERDVRSVADQFGYPTSLVEWHLAEYRRRFVRRLAA